MKTAKQLEDEQLRTHCVELVLSRQGWPSIEQVVEAATKLEAYIKDGKESA